MKYNKILALDPSGSFYEGKGTTGWCLFDCDSGTIRSAGSLFAKNFSSMEAYWDAHLKLIKDECGAGTIVVCEDYLLYATKTESQINSRMETPKLIGCIQLFCYQVGISYYMQTAGEVVKRWENKILEWKGYIFKKGRSYLPYTDINSPTATHHTLDAVRHAVHFNTFKNKER